MEWLEPVRRDAQGLSSLGYIDIRVRLSLTDPEP